MTRTLYAACVAGALALAPVAASAQYATYGAPPYAAPYAPYAYSPYWATPYAYPATASSAWGSPYWYGSNSPWTGQASASSHPAYYGGRGGYAYHPAYGFGY